MKYLETYTACPHCGQALELSPGARDEVADAVAQAVRDAWEKAANDADALRQHDMAKMFRKRAEALAPDRANGADHRRGLRVCGP